MALPISIRVVTLIGAGNVAWHLAKALHSKGYIIHEIWSRTEDSALELTEKFGGHAITSFASLNQDSDLYIIAVNDSAIPMVVRELKTGNNLVVHTAGSVSMKEIAGISSSYGVLYPLQTFSRFIPVNMAEVPFCIEANGAMELALLNQVAGDLTGIVRITNSDERLLLHVAAVFASNYSNLMYTLAKDILSSSGLNFDLLKPLVAETAHKVLTSDPDRVQTGPAKRGDLVIISKHLELLASMPEYAEIYSLLAAKIKERFHR
jgi:predicted short-subunit dehydrogenase-like oxidoreductase (DUF2520 family)